MRDALIEGGSSLTLMSRPIIPLAKWWLSASIAWPLMACGAGPLAEPTPEPPPREVIIAASPPGEGPVDVILAMKRGALNLAPGSGGHLVDGRARASDASLLPHVTVNRRGVAVVQDFDPGEADPTIRWDLALGERPLRLQLHVEGSEHQRLDFGGLDLREATLFNEGGYLDLEWSRPPRRGAEHLHMRTVGLLRVHHLGRGDVQVLTVENLAGRVELSLDGPLRRPARWDLKMAAGSLRLEVPEDTSAAVVAGGAANVVTSGWTETDGGWRLGESEPRLHIALTTGAGAVELVATPIAKRHSK